MRAIRWAGEADRYFGPFTYARDSRDYRPFAIMLGSGDGDDYPGCRLRLSGFGHTLILALPEVIKPWRRWHEITTEPTRSQMIESGRQAGYWDQHETEYGFTAVGGALHWHYGPQTHDSETTKSKCWFFPWRAFRLARHSFYSLDGALFGNLPMSPSYREWQNRWKVEEAIKAACPVAEFEFVDFDGQCLTASAVIEEMEWAHGEGWFKWLSWVRRNKVRRSLKIDFSGETGRRKGSWKGGTIGAGIDMLPGELHEAAFRRYCADHEMIFIGAAEPAPPPPMGYALVDRDVIAEQKGGSVSPLRVVREMALNAGIHGAPNLSAVLNEACGSFNRENHRAGRFKDALKALLFALHARPLFGGPHLSLEDAIAAANELIDRDGPGRQQANEEPSE